MSGGAAAESVRYPEFVRERAAFEGVPVDVAAKQILLERGAFRMLSGFKERLQSERGRPDQSEGLHDVLQEAELLIDVLSSAREMSLIVQWADEVLAYYDGLIR